MKQWCPAGRAMPMPMGVHLPPHRQAQIDRGEFPHMFDMNYQCIMCGEVDVERKKAFDQVMEKELSSQARHMYQVEIQNVALPIFQALFAQNITNSMRDPATSTAQKTLTDMLDSSLAGSIHFVTQLKKLRPPTFYVDQYKEEHPLTRGSTMSIGQYVRSDSPPSEE